MKDKYTNITFKILLLIPSLFILFLVDQFILPQEKINDYITAYSKLEVSRNNSYGKTSKEFIGYKYYTQKGIEFSVTKSYIPENQIQITKSFIFQNINKISTINNDYSDELTSGFNGIFFYIASAMQFTSIISLLLLKFNTNLTENGFQNII
ncbi:hypothetical protein [uncultured Flavobacterium sp.]|uniref:hypothetical protein n=1 Tax=uncultured Flavobacterium sp. TaxID=165435 RepID=UPI0030C88104